LLVSIPNIWTVLQGSGNFENITNVKFLSQLYKLDGVILIVLH
jgi:hypothetical protein